MLLGLVGCAGPAADAPAASNDAAAGSTDASNLLPECPDRAKSVYVVDRDLRFSSFLPATLEFRDRGSLSCPKETSDDQPFSMSVDRKGTAWVLYASGHLFKVDTESLHCETTSFVPDQEGFKTFGMGFVANAPGDRRETLYIAGGSDPLVVHPGPQSFGTLDLETLQVTRRAPLQGLPPELTGTGDARLWAFFPQLGTQSAPPRIVEMDKAQGTESATVVLNNLVGRPEAWAFAFWGGSFYVFLKRDGDDSTRVYHVTRDGTITTALSSTGRAIVGAGVSTCAPYVL